MKNNIVLFLFIFICCVYNLNAQIEISGRVTDCENEPLIGAAVVAKGTVNGSTTDLDGFYKIVVPDTNTILSFSYVNCIPQEKKVGNRKVLDVKMKVEVVDVMVEKPVIYLYPETPTDVSLKVECSGKLLVTYPEYNAGWNIKAHPDGTLIDRDSREYAYLFWEGSKKYKESERQYTQGFVVAGDSTTAFFQDVLPKLGLKPKEYNDFIVYWLPLMKFNKWNFVHFRTGEAYDIISKNIVVPEPETNIRVFMEFKKIEKPFAVEPQSFETPTRKGFTLVEWGGTEMKDAISVKGAAEAF